jgi:hypothetical protein
LIGPDATVTNASDNGFDPGVADTHHALGVEEGKCSFEAKTCFGAAVVY